MNNVHFAIPEIYGETLSYYELLRNLVNKVNELIDNYNNVPDQIAEEVKKLDAYSIFTTAMNWLIHSIATDNTKSKDAVIQYMKHDLLYATFNDNVNLYEAITDFTNVFFTELKVGENIREVNISELFIELRKLIDANKNNIEAVTAVANENSAEIATMHNDISAVENKNTEQDTEISTLRTMISTPYNFKGDVANISALPASGNVNDTYYVQDVKYKVTWTGSAWVQSSLSEADYQTEFSELKGDLVNKYNSLDNKKVNLPTGKYSEFGEDGQLLRTHADGTTEWVSQGLPTDEQTGIAFSKWLDKHPEATTTVQDGSLTHVKFTNELKLEAIKDYVTPQMFGAIGDGVTDDTNAFKLAINSRKPIFIPIGDYVITENLVIANSMFGEDKYKSHLLFKNLNEGSYAITIGVNYLTLDTFRVTSNGETKSVGTTTKFNGLNVSEKLYININNIQIENFNIGLNLGINCWNNKFNLLSIYYCNKGVYLADECNDDTFEDCLIKRCEIGLHKIAGLTVNIIGGDFSYNGKAILLENHGNISIKGTYFELNRDYTIFCTYGMSAFEMLTVECCSFTENNNSNTKVFYFNGNEKSVATVKNCFFRALGTDNIQLTEFKNTKFKPIFIDNRYDDKYLKDTDKAIFVSSKECKRYRVNTNTFEKDINGIEYIIYTDPNIPTGYTVIQKDFIRVDDNSYNVIVNCPINKNYIVAFTNETVRIRGYVSITYVEN